MPSQNSKVDFFDFSGGLNTKSPVTTLKMNEALALDNIILLPTGGFEKRRGNTAHNSSAMNSGANVQALGYYRQADADEWLVSFCGNKGFRSDNLDGTMDDITGAVTITAGANNIWTYCPFNNIAIFVGGAPDAPLKWNGTGNLAALGGSPPSGNFGISAKNRLFIGNTSANPSRIAWSVVGDPEDWSGSGSGTQDVATNDGDNLVGAALAGTDNMFLFKQHSIHILNLSAAPFPLFPFVKGVGAIGKNAIVQGDDGLIYFITPEARMKATDGTTIYTFPDSIDDIWDSLSTSRLQYIQGVFNSRLRQIWWSCTTTGSTNNYCIVWDLTRKCWLRNTTGYKMNVWALAQDRDVYGGAYDGKIYKQDVDSTFTDASETSPGAIDAYWRSGWFGVEDQLYTKVVPYVELNYVSQTGDTMYFSYGYDFVQDRKTESFSMQASGGLWGVGAWGNMIWGGQTDLTKLLHLKGQGKFFQFRIRNANATEQLAFNGLSMPVKKAPVTSMRTS